MVSARPALRVVFFGTPEFAVPTLQALYESRHTVAGVVTQPDRARGRGQKPQPGAVKRLAERHALPLLQPARLRDEAFLESLRALNADLGVVAAYGKILTDEVLQIPRLGLINVHASLLPNYRGAAPIHRAVLAGESETGVTIMRVVKALDAGPMMSKVTRPIGEDETSAEVERDIAQIGAAALVQVVDALAEGHAEESPQDDSRATYAPKIEKSDGLVDWSRTAKAIHNQIRGLHPWPHAFSHLDGERTILLKSAVENDAAPVPSDVEGHAVAPGTIIEAHGDRLLVSTGGGVLRLVTIQREGRRPVSAREFLAGRRIQPGARFVRTEPS
jgi:methionyl-tRNA formyltransferase